MGIFLILILINAGSASGISMELNRGARAFALGGNLTGVKGEIESFYYNPAQLSTIYGFNLSISTYPVVLDVKDQSILLGYGSEKFGVGFNLSYTDYGEFDGLDAHARNPYTYSANDIFTGIGFSYNVQENLYVGGHLRYFKERIDSFYVHSYNLSLGVGGKFNDLDYGVAIRNIGTPLKFISESSKLPYTLSIGVSKYIRPNVFVLGNLEIPADNVPVLSSGVEYSVDQIGFFRLGMRTDRAGILSKLSFGLGAQFKNYNVSFAFSTYQNLGMTYLASFSYKQ